MSTSIMLPQSLVSGALAELAQLDQWVVWKYITRNGKQDKPPFTLNDGLGSLRWASHSQPADWLSYAAAREAQHCGDGLGFVFSMHDPYTGIDLDGCRDPETGAIANWAQTWIERFNSYTEVSPSGTGVKIWVRGRLPKNIGKGREQAGHVGIEVYSHSRYFCFTHQRVDGTPDTIRAAQDVLDELYGTLRPEPSRPEPPPVLSPTLGPTEEALCAREIAAQYNAQHDLTQLLEHYGAVRTRSGYSCPFCEHTHETTLTIAPGGRRGYSHSPRCKLFSEHGFDALNVYAVAEHGGDLKAALRALAPKAERTTTTNGQPAHQHIAQEVEQCRREAQRKRAARKAEAQRLRQAIVERAAADSDLSPRARRQLDIHLLIAGERGWHRASLARQAELSDLGERAVQFANQELIEGGYLRRELTSGSTTAIWSFTPDLRLPGATPARSPVEMSAAAGRSPVETSTRSAVATSTSPAGRSPVETSAAVERSPVATSAAVGRSPLETSVAVGRSPVETSVPCSRSPESERDHLDYFNLDHACKRGAAPAADSEPHDPQCWAWSDPPYGADDLNALDAPNPPQPDRVTLNGTDDLSALDAPNQPQPDRDLLSHVRVLAREVGEPDWFLRDYDAWSDAALTAEAARLEAQLATGDACDAETNCSVAMPSDEASPLDLGVGWSGYANGAAYNPHAAWSLTGQREQLSRSRHMEPWSVRHDWRMETEDEELLTLAPPTVQSPDFSRFIALWLGARQRHRSAAQRLLLRHKALELLVEVPAIEAGRRWDELEGLSSHQGRHPVSRVGEAVRARAAPAHKPKRRCSCHRRAICSRLRTRPKHPQGDEMTVHAILTAGDAGRSGG
jgi:hypothetical protein